MNISLSILGCHSATPRANAHPSAQILQIKNQLYLIDCGEGTQTQIRKYGFSFAKINHIFISHLHGDHFFGLIGLISTMSLLNRKQALHIYAPEGLREIITMQMEISQSKIVFPLHFYVLKDKKSKLILDTKDVQVKTIPLKHRIYANGFLFQEKEGLRKLNIEAVKKYPEIETCDYHNLKKGKDFIQKDGRVISNAILTFPPKKTRSYAYCSDTAYKPEISDIIKGVDMLYHESTFLSDREDLAYITGHSTALQAGNIAKAAQVKHLLLGHYSSRYRDITAFQKEAQTVFRNTSLAKEGETFIIE